MLKNFISHFTAAVSVGFALSQGAEAASELSIRDRLRAPMEELNTGQRLHLACYLGMLDLVRDLVTELKTRSDQFDINQEQNNGLRIHLDVQRNQPVKYDDYSTSLHQAAAGGHLCVVEYLVRNGADLNRVTRFHQYTCLHLAAWGGWVPVIKLLLEHGARLNVYDSDYSTPLHSAVAHGGYRAIQALVKAGADVNAKNRVGHTPIYAAIRKQLIEPIVFLVLHGAHLYHQNDRHITPLQYAIRQANKIEAPYRGSCCSRFFGLMRHFSPVKWDTHLDIVWLLVQRGSSVSRDDRVWLKVNLPRCQPENEWKKIIDVFVNADLPMDVARVILCFYIFPSS